MDVIRGGGSDLSSDLNVVTAEINAYKQMAGESIFEIGLRLRRVKYNPKDYGLPVGTDKGGQEIVARGYWGTWLDSIGIDDSQARRLITIAEKISNRETSHGKGVDALYLIATIPEEERHKSYNIKSTGETKTVDEMTVRELREVKKALKEAEKQRELAERDAQILRDTLESIEDKEPEVEIRTEYVYVEKEERNVFRKIDQESRKQFYTDFINELDFIRTKFGSIALEGNKLRETVESDAEQCRKLDDFDDFWKAFGKSVFKNQTIIEMGN